MQAHALGRGQAECVKSTGGAAAALNSQRAAASQALWVGADALEALLALLADAGLRPADARAAVLGARGARMVVAFLASAGLGRTDMCTVRTPAG